MARAIIFVMSADAVNTASRLQSSFPIAFLVDLSFIVGVAMLLLAKSSGDPDVR